MLTDTTNWGPAPHMPVTTVFVDSTGLDLFTAQELYNKHMDRIIEETAARERMDLLESMVEDLNAAIKRQQEQIDELRMEILT